MNMLSRDPASRHASDLERIRAAFAEALSADAMAEVDSARLALRIARSGAEAARSHLAAIGPDDAEEATAALATAEQDAAAAQARKRRAVAGAMRAIQPAIAQPIEEQRDIALALLAELESAMDPISELHAAMAGRGLPAPAGIVAAGSALHHLREMRRIIGRGATAQRLLNAAEEIDA
jgi:hypothetical protein